MYEHYDLKASINYNCLKSSFSDFSVSLYPINRLDLKAYIIGWFGDKADNLLDLRAFINFSDYQETNYINIHADIYENISKFLLTKKMFSFDMRKCLKVSVDRKEVFFGIRNCL